MKTKIKRTLGALFLFGLVAAAPALAANSVSFGGGRADIDPSVNFRVRACDTQVDGHRARAWFYSSVQNPAEPTITPFAPSGGCTPFMATGWGFPIVEYRICVEAEGCSPWTRRG